MDATHVIHRAGYTWDWIPRFCYSIRVRHGLLPVCKSCEQIALHFQTIQTSLFIKRLWTLKCNYQNCQFWTWPDDLDTQTNLNKAYLYSASNVTSQSDVTQNLPYVILTHNSTLLKSWNSHPTYDCLIHFMQTNGKRLQLYFALNWVRYFFSR